MDPAQQQLTAALDALDLAFADEEPFTAGGCTYCYGEEHFAELSGPPHLVSEDMVSAVAFEVPDHWDDFPRLYRRLTPRILRAAATDTLHVDVEVIPSRLLRAAWTTWPPAQAAALRDFWPTWWRATLHTHPDAAPISAREVLSVITVATGTLRPWLDIWTSIWTASADAHLAEFVDDVLVESEITDLEMGFYGEYHATAELMDWLLTDIRDRVHEPGLDDPDHLDFLLTEARAARPDTP
ncbi:MULTISPECIES: hypothetical protein [unclassified Streptomyces]|uniref:hypothetical protein n=1 Tax=unclassified Streptomyces TaxID=2593676 RepID=UPI0013193754|nr:MULTISPECIES: hypothetical protein [unclassified Streptomyces]QHC15835.1 hypothetical protein GR131_10485 [Streptomyces sp. GF20]